MNFVILTGASASGKSTITKMIAADKSLGITCLHFDSIGVPSVEQMTKEFGSVENWQRAKTFQWMARIQNEFLSAGGRVLFEGQMRISFILEALQAAKINSYKLILIDCDDSTRESRLRVDRHRPELANARMRHWARFLRNEATRYGILSLDTSKGTIKQMLFDILAIFEKP
jgi:adenylate kinase family enzyme